MAQSKRIRVNFCEETLMIQESELPRYQKKAEELYQLAIKAGYSKEQARAEFYLTIVKDEQYPKNY